MLKPDMRRVVYYVWLTTSLSVCCGCNTSKHIEQDIDIDRVNKVVVDSSYLHQLLTDSNLKVKVHIIEYPSPDHYSSRVNDNIETRSNTSSGETARIAPQREIYIEVEQHTTQAETTQHKQTIDSVSVYEEHTNIVKDKKTSSSGWVTRLGWFSLLLLVVCVGCWVFRRLI